jgi:hypothetical protein
MLYQSAPLWRSSLLFLAVAAITPAYSQSGAPIPTVSTLRPPEFPVQDEYGVELVGGFVSFQVPTVRIGGEAPLVHYLGSQSIQSQNQDGSGQFANGFYRPYPLKDPFNGGLTSSSIGFVFEFDGVSERFSAPAGVFLQNAPAGTVFTSKTQRGGRLTTSGGGVYVYTDRNGIRYHMSDAYRVVQGFYTQFVRVHRVEYPDGRVLTIQFQNNNITGAYRSDGFQILYDRDALGQVSSVKAVNRAFAYCTQSASACQPSASWPVSTLTFSNSDKNLVIQDAGAAKSQFKMDQYYRVTEHAPPGSNTFRTQYSYCNRVVPINCFYQVRTGGTWTTVNFPDKVFRVVRDGVPINYRFTSGIAGYYNNYVSSHPSKGSRELMTLIFQSDASPISYIRDREGRQASFSLDQRNLIGQVTSPGQATPLERFLYDARGNVTRRTIVSSSGEERFEEHVFPAICSNPVTCNKPSSTRDFRGFQTDYEYDPVHGGVTKISRPAVDGVRPVELFVYEQRHAVVLGPSGALVQSELPIWVLSKAIKCSEGASTGNPSSPCADPSKAITETFEYPSSSVAHNAKPVGRRIEWPGRLERQCFTYDRYGNKATVLAPNAGASSC